MALTRRASPGLQRFRAELDALLRDALAKETRGEELASEEFHRGYTAALKLHGPGMTVEELVELTGGYYPMSDRSRRVSDCPDLLRDLR
jgi:hypothetical protein